MFDHASHNRAYTLVWNEEQQAWVPAPETSRARGKRSGRAVLAMAGLLVAASAHALDPGAHPTGGSVVAGQAQITQSGNATTINQSSSSTIINWQTFDIGSQSRVDFLQPSSNSVALNRVIGQDPTQIFGSLHANGQVFLVNPNGVLFGAGAQVSAAGVLASTRDIADADFLSGKFNFAGSSHGSVVNQGTVSAASGGYVVLVGAQVINDGTISAPRGDVRLAAADRVTLRVDGAGLASFSVDRGTLDALVANRGAIVADGGRIWLTAEALDKLAKAMVNNTGLIEAQTVGNDHGTIVLQGDMGVGTVAVGGTLDASAPNGGDGGSIETSAAHVDLHAAHRVTTAAADGRSGHWLIDPTNFTIGTGGDETAAQLQTDLASGNVEIQSSSGSTGTAGNVIVNDAISWSANRLTLTAQNNVLINANLTGTGSAALTLKVGQGAVAAGNSARYVIADGVSISLPTGLNFSTITGSDGATQNYYVINSLGSAGSTTGTDLQGMQGNLAGLYALGSDIDASATAGWNTAQGFAPIGDASTAFSGRFEGLGHVISGLTINRPFATDVALFGATGAQSVVANVHLTGANINGDTNVAALVGDNAGTVSNASTSTGSVSGNINTGGLVGTSEAGASVLGSSSGGDVYGVTSTGGLIGLNAGTVSASSSGGTVTSEADDIGGAIGASSGSVSGVSSSATVDGSAANHVGGLVGNLTGGTVVAGSATGSVVGIASVGGLVGAAQSGTSITGSSAGGAVTATANGAGGLVGTATGTTISNSSASGNVGSSGELNIGGLVGQITNNGSTHSSITGSSATGTVSGTRTGGAGSGNVGGLVGSAEGSISSSFATGAVTATSDNDGGLVGLSAAAITGSHATGSVNG